MKAPNPTPETLEEAGISPSLYYGFILEIKGGSTIGDTLTISYQGKQYTGYVTFKSRFSVDQGETIFDGAMVVVPSITAKLAYPVHLYRMYNTKTSEHLWTKSQKEYESAGSGNYADWKAEGVAWYVPVSSAKPVYRLYNTKSGDHHYTTSLAEKDKLVSSGQWRDEGIAFYSASKKDTNTITIYRVYNSRLKRGQHHYTKSAAERDSLVKNSGWKDEGVGFYGYSSANPEPV